MIVDSFLAQKMKFFTQFHRNMSYKAYLTSFLVEILQKVRI